MIQDIFIKNYKNINSIDYRLSKLTLFTGYNDFGKTNCISVLLLLNYLIKTNGMITKLDNFNQYAKHIYNNACIKINIIIDNHLCEIEFTEKEVYITDLDNTILLNYFNNIKIINDIVKDTILDNNDPIDRYNKIIECLYYLNENDILIIEYPEYGLHPSIQHDLIVEICEKVQDKNIQVILETHSDHIVNGIRVKIREYKQTQRGIDCENVIINNIKDYDNMIPVVINSDGRFVGPIVFDQYENDLLNLF